jgi:phage gpG-like protein
MLEVTMIPPAAVMAALFAKLAHEFDDLSKPLHKAVEEVMAPSLAANFAAGGRPTWAAHSQNTEERHPEIGSVLIATGALEGAASSPGLWSVTATEATAQGGPDYGGIHQTGWSYGPARVWALFQPEDEARIEEVFLQWIDTISW